MFSKCLLLCYFVTSPQECHLFNKHLVAKHFGMLETFDGFGKSVHGYVDP